MKIALVQSALVWGKIDENLRNFTGKLVHPLGAEVIILPEMFTSGCVMGKKSSDSMLAGKAELAGHYPEVCRCMLEWAGRQNALVMGSAVCGEGGKYYNRLIAAFPDGRLLHYDKRHCFRMGGENEHFSPGHQQLVFDFRGVRIAAFICYDLRFPVWCRNTSDYDLAVFVANWPESRREVWNVLLRARAIENQSFVAGVNCVGVDSFGLNYTGDSCVADARGQVIARAREGEEEIVVVECDIEALREFRRKFSVLEDRDTFIIKTD